MTSNDSPEKDNGVPSSSVVGIHDHGEGVFAIRVADVDAGNALSSDLAGQLVRAIDTVRNAAAAKVLILEGSEEAFLRGGRAHCNEALEKKLYQSIVDFPYPVIAAMRGGADGAGFLAAALCDFMVCATDAAYRYTQPEAGLFPSAAEDRLFSERFGRLRAADFLYQSTSATGRQLQEKGWTCAIVPQDQVEAHARKLASHLAEKSQVGLRLLKQHLARRIRELAQALEPVQPAARREPGPRDAAGIAEIAAPGEHLRLETPAENVLLVRIRETASKGEAGALVMELGALFKQINVGVATDRVACRAVVLVSECADFLPALEGAAALDAVLGLQSVLRQSSPPLIAVLPPQASAKAWLIGQFCDAAVHAHEGNYCAADLLHDPAWARLAARVFTDRFGGAAGRDIALAGAAYTGADLRRRIGPVPVAAQEQAVSEAVRLAQSWAGWPLDTVALRKTHGPIGAEELDDRPATEAAADAKDDRGAAPAPIPLASKVITATAYPDGVVAVHMEDREAKNLFSPEFVRGMNEIFRHIDETPEYKVVVLTGYDKYFASGGTREALEAIQDGRAKFTDEQTYLLALQCRIPVVAAMQGHGIGGGLSLGLFADFILLGEESKYLSPYMGYGFTPGAGATLIVPEKLGPDLGRETLLTAQEYSGSELRERGLALPVHPRKEVHAAAMALARDVARYPRANLIRLKQYLNRSIHERMDSNTQQEISMHERTFVGRADTLKQIQANFNPMDDGANTQAAQQADNTATVANTPAHSLPEITAGIKQLLAQELHMQPGDIDEDTPFVDLGLDSITGVTWMRKINDRYRTSIQATKVYSHPTLTQLGAYIKEEIENADPAAGAATSATGAAPAKPAAAAAPVAPAPVGAPVAAPMAAPAVAPVLDLAAPARFVPPAEPRIASAPPAGAGAPSSRKSRSKLVSWRDQKTSRVSGAGGGAAAMPAAQPIAVIGMAGQFPMAKTLDQYWDNIAQGRNCISEIPGSRWDLDTYYQEGDPAPGKTNSKWMGHLEEFDLFDPLFFDISPKEAMSMDPQQRVFLQTAWHAIENAGYNPRSLSGGKCGVFVGCGPGDYHLLSRDLQISALGFTGGDTAILAARVSYFLNLQGPCLAIETACSSSLVAIATACDSLVTGNSDLALAGGVGVMTGPELHIKMAQTGMLSRDGRCFTFDQRANGFAPGEGVGAVLLKRLADAERDEDIVLGVIRGWGVNQDGKTNGITAPNPDSQTRLEQEVYDKFGIDPAGIQMIEAHGTGTKLGDPIEVDALKQAFKKYTQKKSYCALGSVKSNIGHCFTAAGVASVIKVVLALGHKQLPPTINYARLNEHIVLDNSPFYVNDRLRAWELDGAERRQAAVSGFGFGGTNAHLVIAEYAAPAKAKAPVSVLTENGKLMFPLSAKAAEPLRRKAADLLEFVTRKGRSVDLAGIAYTLQIGREAMDERLGFMAGSHEELAAKLKSWLAGEPAGDGIYQGRARDSKEAMSLLRRDADMRETIIDKLLAQRQLSKLLDLWVKDLEFDWNKLYGDAKPRRVQLPTYPFAKERYWIDAARSAQEAKTAALAAALHPLVHRNTSNLRQLSYSSAFRGDESFLEDRAGGDGKVLSEAACLEMARVAAAMAASMPPEDANVELRDIAWGRTFVAARDKEVSIALFANADESIDFEIYSVDAGEETVHCQGRAVVAPVSAAAGAGVQAPAKAQATVKAASVPATVPATAARSVAATEMPAPLISQAQLQQELKESLAAALFMKPADIRVDKPFIELGLDSIVGVEWVNELNKKYGVKITAARVYDYPNVAELAAYLRQEIEKASPASTVVSTGGDAVADASADASADEPAASPAMAEDAAEDEVEYVLDEAVEDTPQELISHAQLQQELKESLATALFMKPADIRVDKPFIELGLDSIVGVEWVNELNKTYGVKITAARVYDYPNIAELASYLRQEIEKIAAAAPKRAPAVRAAPARAHAVRKSAVPARVEQTGRPAPSPEVSSASLQRSARIRQPAARGPVRSTGKIAVIGMSGRYPQAKDLKQFWDNLAQGRNSVTEIPPSRWDVEQYYDPDPKKEDKIYCKWMGMLDDVDCFDSLFFKISPAEAKNMDPQHRLFLEESYKAFENAGYSGKALNNKKCGVYVGIIGTEYAGLVSNAVDITGNNPAIGAARIAYFLNLKGPAISIDTACSASLVAIHLACQGLLNHETDMALAGGVSIWLHPETYMGMCRAGMLSPDGQCKTFDNSANGFVPGEGVGAVVLKRLEDAERDNDFIHGVILGSAINQDGKTNGITAPSVNSQIELERDLYARCGIDPETISYVETHGTGTKLGDPIELEALATVFKEKTAKKNFCGLGSVKSNIGHTSGAAGVASVQKVLLCMKHGMLVPSLHVTKENSLFDFKDSPFYVSKQTRPWEAAPGGKRRAAVSSFGFSGTNAHLVLEEYAPPADRRPDDAGLDAGIVGPIIVPLSARTADQLQQRAQDLLKFIRSADRAPSTDLMSIAHTLFVGRDAMDERLGFIVDSVDQLAAKLEAWLGGDRHAGNVFRGKVERSEDGVILLSQQEGMADVVDQCLACGDLPKLVELWTRGLDLEWSQLHGPAKPRRIGLPTYPFARKRYWADAATNDRAASGRPAETRAVAAALHPLVHRNVSVLGQQSYSSTFSGQEAFLVEEGGRKVLPAAAYLEMVRAALEDAAPVPHEATHLELHHVAWGRPLVAAPDRQVNIALFRKSDGQVDFEIYSLGQGTDSLAEEVVHCQGHAVLDHDPVRIKLDIEKLKGRMLQVRIAADVAAYGDGIAALHRGDGELLAHLQLSAAVDAELNDYVLHPDLMDELLRAAAGLTESSTRRARHLSLPFALESMRIESACTTHMLAWARHAQGSGAQDKVIRLDIDLCDLHGNVCVQMRGIAYDTVYVGGAVTALVPAVAPAAVPTTAPAVAPAAAPAALPATKAAKPTIALEQIAEVAPVRPGVALSDPQSASFAPATAHKPQISLQ
ncbi:MAG TPA: beta-ketoacyl synthase N-terminal-like domain-containing protein [Paucimonas sp.]|nr:beta-ketoacyl synthase N-terminal-like domain-containing protein [Paucimonas sp.]